MLLAHDFADFEDERSSHCCSQQDHWADLHGSELHTQHLPTGTLHNSISPTHLQDLGAIKPVAHTLADHLCSAHEETHSTSQKASRRYARSGSSQVASSAIGVAPTCGVAQVQQRLLVHSCERAAAGAGVRLPRGRGCHDAAVGNDDHILAAELLLQLPHQALLDLVERLQQPVGHLRR
jgi:hypothetical protein